MPSRALNRRDPLKGKNGFSTHKGFTVIELMIAVAVIAIITSLALPSYRDLIEKRRVTSSAQQLSAFLSSAHMEAIKRNRNIAVRCSVGTGQCESLQLSDRDGEPAELSLSIYDLKNIDDNAESPVLYGNAQDQLEFDAVRGMLVPANTVAMPLEIQLASPEHVYALNVRVAATGRVSVCSDLARADKAVPGHSACQNLEAEG